MCFCKPCHGLEPELNRCCPGHRSLFSLRNMHRQGQGFVSGGKDGRSGVALLVSHEFPLVQCSANRAGCKPALRGCLQCIVLPSPLSISISSTEEYSLISSHTMRSARYYSIGTRSSAAGGCHLSPLQLITWEGSPFLGQVSTIELFRILAYLVSMRQEYSNVVFVHDAPIPISSTAFQEVPVVKVVYGMRDRHYSSGTSIQSTVQLWVLVGLHLHCNAG